MAFITLSPMKRNVSEVIKKRVAAEFKYQCASCLKLVDDSHQIDHVVPLWAGGGNDKENLQLLCWRCHHTKTGDETILRAAYKQRLKQLAGLRKSEALCWQCCKVTSTYFKHTCHLQG